MPINIKECDGDIGLIIESKGTVTDQELIDSLERYLTKTSGFKYLQI
jgi:hypothetical protein